MAETVRPDWRSASADARRATTAACPNCGAPADPLHVIPRELLAAALASWPDDTEAVAFYGCPGCGAWHSREARRKVAGHA